mmetsp:Transcript_96547/g.223860  ORF Transcript_96547/g.223860 Transcript_96547/m.223860 type:complete len:218 (-) Transcript_96547:83-736(-)
MRFEGVAGLARLIAAWRQEFGIKAEVATSAAEEEVLKLPAGWSPRPAPGAPKLTPTVTESLDLFSQGHDLAAVALKKAKQVIASTVEGHLATALLNADPRIVRNLGRLKHLLPVRSEVEKIQAALQKTGSDPMDPKMAMGPVALELGGEEGKSQWYSKIKWYTVLLQLGLPMVFEADASAASAQSPVSQKRDFSQVSGDSIVGQPTPQKARPLTIGF